MLSVAKSPVIFGTTKIIINDTKDTSANRKSVKEPSVSPRAPVINIPKTILSPSMRSSQTPASARSITNPLRMCL